MNRRPREEFSKATKTAAFDRSGGRCEECTAKLFPGRFIYDHDIPTALGGEATLENCKVICSACNKAKTATDQGVIAKARRREEKHLGMRKRGWQKPPGAKFNWQRGRYEFSDSEATDG